MPAEAHLVLHHMVIKGLAGCEAIARASGLDPETVLKVVEALAAEGLAVERTGRLQGFSPTPSGRELHQEVLGTSGLRVRKDELSSWYERFEAVNTDFKEVCTAWQIVAGPGVPNDHTDAEYDRTVLARLVSIHDRAISLLDEVDHPRLLRYADRLEEALGAVQAGDTRRFTAPLCESYHDVWMELHHDLLTSFARPRAATDA